MSGWRILPDKQRLINELSEKGDVAGLLKMSSEYETRNPAIAEETKRRADKLYEKQNPNKFACTACEFSSRERQKFTTHLEDEHSFQKERAEREAKRQEDEQAGKQISD